MTLPEQIQALEASIARIYQQADHVIGGSSAYHSGKQTFLTAAAQRRVDRMNKQLDALYDKCEA